MAVSDLTKELEKEAYKPDAASQKKIVQGLVAVLTNDTASEVRSCVIKWYVQKGDFGELRVPLRLQLEE
jgi:hypothetical protein